MSHSEPITTQVTSKTKQTRAESYGYGGIIFGMIFIAIAIWQSVEATLFLRGAETVEGKIMRVNSFYDRNRHGEYLACRSVIRFQDQRGEEHDLVHESQAARQVGDQMIVSYHKGIRSPARVTSGLWSGPLVFAGIGALFGIAGVLSDSRILRRLGAPMMRDESVR